MHVYVRCAHVILKIGMRYANESGKREDTDFQVFKTENVDGLIGLCCVVKFIYVLIIAPLITLSPLLILRLLCRMFFLCAKRDIHTIGSIKRESADRNDLVSCAIKFGGGASEKENRLFLPSKKSLF
ncbi:hypothetical protein ACS0PU_006019 [Formica fusca]